MLQIYTIICTYMMGGGVPRGGKGRQRKMEIILAQMYARFVTFLVYILSCSCIVDLAGFILSIFRVRYKRRSLCFLGCTYTGSSEISQILGQEFTLWGLYLHRLFLASQQQTSFKIISDQQASLKFWSLHNAHETLNTRH